jgi:hypothetical protein
LISVTVSLEGYLPHTDEGISRKNALFIIAFLHPFTDHSNFPGVFRITLHALRLFTLSFPYQLNYEYIMGMLQTVQKLLPFMASSLFKHQHRCGCAIALSIRIHCEAGADQKASSSKS